MNKIILSKNDLKNIKDIKSELKKLDAGNFSFVQGEKLIIGTKCSLDSNFDEIDIFICDNYEDKNYVIKKHKPKTSEEKQDG